MSTDHTTNVPATDTQATSPGWLPHVLLLLVVIVWGTTFALVKAALRDISPLLFNALRMALAAAVLLLWNLPALRSLRRPELALGAGAGVLLALGYELQTAGLVYTSPSRSAFLTSLVVVLVPLFSVLPGVQVPGMPRPGALTFAGALLAFAGVVLLTAAPGGASHPFSRGLFDGLGVGEWLSLGCAVAFAAHLLTVAQGARVISAGRFATLQIAVAALVMALGLPLERHRVLHWTPAVVTALLVTGLLATAAAFLIQTWAQSRMAATHVAIIFTLEPVLASFTSLLFLGERLGARALSGGSLIIRALLLIELGPSLRRHRRTGEPAAALIPPLP